MTGDHQPDLSSHERSNDSTSRPDRGRSICPRPLRGDSLGPDLSFTHDGRGNKRRMADSPKKVDYRGGSGNRASDANFQRSQTTSHKKRKIQGDGPETKGLSDKIHSLRRLLEKATDMPADVWQEKNRELQGYLADQQRRQARREKNALTSRYHFVRFMERKKADRRLKQLEKKLDEAMMSTSTAPLPGVAAAPHDGGAESEGGLILNGVDGSSSLSSAQRLALQQEHLKRQVHEAKVDLNYTLYAPLHQKYISLYPGGQKKGHGQNTNKEAKAGQTHDVSVNDDEAGLFRNTSGQKPPLWHEVENAMKNNTLEALRDGKLFQAESKTLTFRGIGESVQGGGVPDLQSDPGDKHKDMDSEEDFFER